LTSSSIPKPSRLFETLDEHPDSINDGWFQAFPHLATATSGPWYDMPSSCHDGACGFGFADGHSEIHKWKSKVTIVPVLAGANPGVEGQGPPISSDPNAIVDASWFVSIASVPN